MSAFFTFLLSLSILIPVLTSIVCFKKLDRSYYPIVALLIIGLFTEFLNYYLIIGLGLRNGISSKIYNLIECSLLLYQLYLWRGSKKVYKIYIAIYGICLLTWIVENVFILKLDEHGPYFREVKSFFIVLLSINLINARMMRPEISVLKNPIIVFCVAFIVFFTYVIVLETARILLDHQHNIGVIAAYDFMNFATNVLFSIALLLVKGKDRHDYKKYLANR